MGVMPDSLAMVGKQLFASVDLETLVDEAIRQNIPAAYAALREGGDRPSKLRLRRQIATLVMPRSPILASSPAISVAADAAGGKYLATVRLMFENQAALLFTRPQQPVAPRLPVATVVDNEIVLSIRFTEADRSFVSPLIQSEIELIDLYLDALRREMATTGKTLPARVAVAVADAWPALRSRKKPEPQQQQQQQPCVLPVLKANEPSLRFRRRASRSDRVRFDPLHIPYLEAYPVIKLADVIRQSALYRDSCEWFDREHVVGDMQVTALTTNRLHITYSCGSQTGKKPSKQIFTLVDVPRRSSKSDQRILCPGCLTAVSEIFYRAGSWKCKTCHELVRKTTLYGDNERKIAKFDRLQYIVHGKRNPGMSAEKRAHKISQLIALRRELDEMGGPWMDMSLRHKISTQWYRLPTDRTGIDPYDDMPGHIDRAYPRRPVKEPMTVKSTARKAKLISPWLGEGED